MNENDAGQRPGIREVFEIQTDYLPGAPHEPSSGRALARFVTLLLLLALVAVIAGKTVVASPVDEIGAGSLLFHTDAGDVEAPRLETQVDIAVSGMLARVDVRQRFHNPGADHVEGIYVFPLPDDAAVDSLKLRIGERLILGEIQEKSAARATYAQARDSGQRAGLVEQQRPNLFTTAVANIAPGETIEVEIAYLQTLRFSAGVFSIRFPMTVTPRYEPAETPVLASAGPTLLPAVYRAAGAPANEATINVRIDAGFPLARIESLYHTMDTVQAGDIYLLKPETGAVPMDRDLELVWQPALGSEPKAAVFTEHWGDADYAVIMLMPPDTGALTLDVSREVIFVIDTSGSMGGTSIRQARDALRFAIGRLGPRDRFNVIRFASTARALFRYAVTADYEHRIHALAFVDSLDANGGTEIGKALDLALDAEADRRAVADGYLRQVVFVTDGSVGNEQELFARISRELGATRLFTVGIGAAPNDWFMRKAAGHGRGTFTHIGGDHLIEERMEALLARLEQPVLRDIEIEPPPGAIVWPERIRDLYAGEPVVVRARLATTAGVFRLRGNQASVPWEQRLTLDTAGDNPGVAALWARGRIEALIDSLVTGADPERVRTDVIDLALRHHLVSRYTSLVAVDRTPGRPAGMPLASAMVPVSVPRGSVAAFPSGATPAALLGLLGFMTLMLSGIAALTGRNR